MIPLRAAVAGCLLAAALAAATLLWPWQVRHSAPFGFNLSLDAERGLAVRGASILPNYPNFDRLDLDLRAYTPGADYDLTVQIRPAEPGAGPIRSIPLPLPAERIWHDKGPFADPFVTLRFPPISDAASQSYYVWVDSGPRNRDDVVALWSVKSYSRVTGYQILRAALDRAPGPPAPAWRQAAVGITLLGLIAAFGWLLAALLDVATSAAAGSRSHSPRRGTASTPRHPPVAREMRRSARHARHR